MNGASIRIKAGVLYAPQNDSLRPVLRFIDPDAPEEEGEFFTVEVKYLDRLITELRRCAVAASERADELGRASPAERLLLAQDVGGRA